MGVNGKNKGNSYEREIAKELSLAISGGKDKYVFWRTASSGAMGPQAKTSYGDITFMKEEGIPFVKVFTVECKRSRVWNLFTIFKSEKTPLNKWWEQSDAQARKASNFPLLIFKLDRMNSMCVLKEAHYNKIFKKNNFPKINIKTDKLGSVFILELKYILREEVIKQINLIASDL